MQFFLNKDLNPEQQRAVSFRLSPLLILAGAGSGKTRALTYRAAYLILEKAVAPENILLLTFTNKAAGEMKERLKNLLNHQSPVTNHQSLSIPYAGTFHSFCSRFLRTEGRHLGLSPSYLIYDQSDQLDLVKQTMISLDISPRHFKPAAILNAISGAKNELISELEYPQYSHGYFQETVAKVYLTYQKMLKDNEAVDFDDLIFLTVKVFRQNPEILSSWQNRFQYLLVDEYQDTNQAQYELVRIFAKKWRHLTVVGDASQSIYGWRGANFRNVLKLKNDFPELTIINLEQNYRSWQNILDAAHAVITNNTTHPVLKLWTDKEKGQKITLYEASSGKDEAQFIVNEIVKKTEKPGFSLKPGFHHYSNFAVLYRTNAQSRVLEEAFLHAGIPYILVGGTRFYERKEIKDCLALLRLLINPRDSVSFTRIEKLGKKRLKLFLESSKKIKMEKTTTKKILTDVMNITDYWSLYDKKDTEDLARLENIKELFSVAQEFPKIMDFLENVSLVQQEYFPASPARLDPAERAGGLSHPFKDQKTNHVTLMTAHSAKGLEFQTVFIVGLEEGLFPHSQSLMDKEELEEERRLCYVAITRAKEKLYLLYARRRLYFGVQNYNQISRFITEIPKNLLEFKCRSSAL